MKSCLLSVALLACPVLTVRASEPPPVLSLAPADALVIVYLEQPNTLLQSPLLTELQPPAQLAAMLQAVSETFSGPTMLALCGSPINPASIRLELATRPSTGAADFFKNLNEKLLPRLTWGNSAGKSESSGALHILRTPGPIPLMIYMAEKEGLVFGSGDRRSVDAWLAGREIPQRFVSSDDYPRLCAVASTASRPDVSKRDALIYVNCRTLMPFAGAHLDSAAMPGLSSTLGLDRVEAAALSLNWSSDRLGANLAVGIAEGEGGLPKLLAPHTAPVRIAELLPQNYTAFVRGAITSVADSTGVINGILNAIDADIVAEYTQECADARKQLGFDPHEDFLANLVDEWMVGFRLEPGGQTSLIAAVGLADPQLFESHFAALVRAFGLEYEQTVYRDAVVRSTPPSATARFAMATLDHYLVFARDAEQIHQIVDAWTDEKSIQSSKGYSSLAARLPAAPAELGYLDLARLSRLGLTDLHKGESPAFVDALQKLSASDASLGIAVTTRPGVLDIDLALNAGGDSEARDVLAKSVAAALTRKRMHAQRMVSAANLKGIITSCLIYAHDHKGTWPSALSTLVQDGSCLISQLTSPLDDSPTPLTVENLDRESYYLYRPGKGLAATEVVVCERELRDGGANFGFVDGHVEWITGPRATELLATMTHSVR